MPAPSGLLRCRNQIFNGVRSMRQHSRDAIRIGGASGFWGESDMGLPQLLQGGKLDYIVFDYLAEITMSIMARARAQDPQMGYATDFVTAAIKPHLREIASRGVKLVSNGGGTAPEACGAAIRALIEQAGLDLKVAVVTGDDLTKRADEFADAHEMFSGAPFPSKDKIASINAYLGAFPIAEALSRGADIVITGRCVDSALTLGPCIHEFGLTRDDLDALAGCSLAGHILECGPQATGGNFTDWDRVEAELADVGYPIAEIAPDGSFDVTKPPGTGGLVSVGSVGEQLLYEIGDPQAYVLPDVVCDLSEAIVEQAAVDLVRVRGTRGKRAPDTYKASATWSDGWKISTLWYFIGEDASTKAHSFARTAIARAKRKLSLARLGDFTDVSIETLGDESHYGAYRQQRGAREVALKLAVKHPDAKACSLLLKEATGLGLSAPPGLALYSGGRPKPSPVVRLFSLQVPKADFPITIGFGDSTVAFGTETGGAADSAPVIRPQPPGIEPGEHIDLVEVPLIRLAFARSGDKGDKVNIGVLPRRRDYIPWIWAALTEAEVSRRFAHFTEKPAERFFLPGTGAINFLLHDVLGGGGVASLRNDPQGKCYAQILLQTPVQVPRAFAEALRHG